ncbi:hypothetical protein ES708_18472 [subsurface metagenome]
MSQRVGRIGKLVGHKVFLVFSRHLPRLGNSRPHPQCPIGQDKLGAVNLEQLPPFHTHVVGHDDGDLVALLSPQPGQCDAGIAAGGFDDSLVPGQLAALLRLFYHVLGHAVLDTGATARVLPFQLDQDFYLFGGARLLQLYEWGVSQSVDDIFKIHHSIL